MEEGRWRSRGRNLRSEQIQAQDWGGDVCETHFLGGLKGTQDGICVYQEYKNNHMGSLSVSWFVVYFPTSSLFASALC